MHATYIRCMHAT